MNYDLREQPGCLGGLLRLFALRWVYGWLQDNVGRGRGGCTGMGCGAILFIVFVLLACSIVFNTNWFDFGF
jgi:hypothetical protein